MKRWIAGGVAAGWTAIAWAAEPLPTPVSVYPPLPTAQAVIPPAPAPTLPGTVVPAPASTTRPVVQSLPGAPDVTLVAADYSQIELRILAHVSGDEHLRDAFARGADIHRVVPRGGVPPALSGPATPRSGARAHRARSVRHLIPGESPGR